MEKYRKDEYGKVFEYDAEEKAYFFIGKLNRQSLKQFIFDYEYEINMMISEGRYDN